MSEGSYELGARVGLGLKMTHELALAAFHGTGDPQEYLAVLTGRADEVVQFVIDLQAKYLAQTAFPGSTVETPAQAPPPLQAPAQFVGGEPTYAAPPQSAPAPIPNQSRGGGDWKAQKADANWQTFFQDTTAWDDLRGAKALGSIKPGNPDFRHRSLKDGDYKLGVWIKDAPAWAVDRLRQMGVQV